MDLLDTADTASQFAETLAATRAYTTILDVSGSTDLNVLVVPVMTTRKRVTHGGYRRDIVLEILLRQHMSTDTDFDEDVVDDGVELLEQIDDYLADPDNHDLTLPDTTLASYVEPTDNRADAEIRSGLGILWVRDHLQNLRQITSVVRVAYAIDETY